MFQTQNRAREFERTEFGQNTNGELAASTIHRKGMSAGKGRHDKRAKCEGNFGHTCGEGSRAFAGAKCTK